MMSFSLMAHSLLLKEATQISVVCHQEEITLCIIYPNDYELRLTALEQDKFRFEVINLWADYENDRCEKPISGICNESGLTLISKYCLSN